jgi:hypothetical protein
LKFCLNSISAKQQDFQKMASLSHCQKIASLTHEIKKANNRFGQLKLERFPINVD